MALLEFLYTDSVKELNIELALPLLIAAEQYMLDRLKALCEDSIRKKVNKDTVIPILRASHHHRSEALKEICMEFVCKRYEEVKHTKGFKDLLLEPELMMELLMKL
jgi:speckle-type POZ protein